MEDAKIHKGGHFCKFEGLTLIFFSNNNNNDNSNDDHDLDDVDDSGYICINVLFYI